VSRCEQGVLMIGGAVSSVDRILYVYKRSFSTLRSSKLSSPRDASRSLLSSPKPVPDGDDTTRRILSSGICCRSTHFCVGFWNVCGVHHIQLLVQPPVKFVTNVSGVTPNVTSDACLVIYAIYGLRSRLLHILLEIRHTSYFIIK